MYNITFISTIHKEIGKCNADELCKIIEKVKPEVIFLEALEDTYSEYDYKRYSQFGVPHNKLEVSAIQKYQATNRFEYVPMLDNGLSDAFDKKYDTIGVNQEFQILLESFQALSGEGGFNFLNSQESTRLQSAMRTEELRILNNAEVAKEVDAEIDEYENAMLRNIYSYCEKNQFNSAIFMCGVAHRKSIIQKIDKDKIDQELNLNWLVYEM